MNMVHEPGREIPVLATTEVLVVGGGPAGLAAALAAARAGSKVLLVERYGCLGGTISQVGVETIAWYRHDGTVDCKGIGTELEQRAVDEGIARKESQSDSHVVDSELFKVLADKLLAESHVDVLLHVLVVGALVKDGFVQGVLTESKSGRYAILAQRVVDCSGDADVAARAGAPFTKRDKEELMGVTVMFSCSGVDSDRFLQFVHEDLRPTYADWGKNWSIKTSGLEDNLFSPYLEEVFSKAQVDGVIPGDAQSIAGTYSTFTDAGEACCLNVIYSYGYDCTDVRDLTKAEIEGRQQALWAIQAFRHYLPGFEHARLRNFGMTLGTRESRQIEGMVRVTKEYVLNEGRCDDSIGIFPEFIDGSGYLILPLTGRYYQIPLGCLIPKTVNNLLVAGRCVSTDVIGHTSMRNIMCCMVTGQGAGTAAAVSLQDCVSVWEVSPQAVQRELLRQGARYW